MESEPENADISSLNIYQRIREIKREVHGIKQRRHTMGFNFAGHDAVTAALSPLYVQWGVDREVTVISALRVDGIIGMNVQVSWVNVDNPEDRKTVMVFAEGVDITKRDGSLNTDGLASGKGLSYAVKMAELKNFCLVGDTTPDSEVAKSAPDVPPPTDTEYSQLVELYKSCSTKPELDAIRTMVSPLVQQKKLSPEQSQELSKLDSEARTRIK